MSAADVLSRLQFLIDKAENMTTIAHSIRPTDSQCSSSTALCSKLLEIATTLRRIFEEHQKTSAQRAQRKANEHISHAKKTMDPFLTGKSNSLLRFKRNISSVFGDSGSASTRDDRRESDNRKRRNILLGLRYEALIWWAAAYPPTLWTSGEMGKDIFNCLVMDAETKVDEIRMWPLGRLFYSLDQNELQKLKEHKELLRGLFHFICERNLIGD